MRSARPQSAVFTLPCADSSWIACQSMLATAVDKPGTVHGLRSKTCLIYYRPTFALLPRLLSHLHSVWAHAQPGTQAEGTWGSCGQTGKCNTSINKNTGQDTLYGGKRRPSGSTAPPLPGTWICTSSRLVVDLASIEQPGVGLRVLVVPTAGIGVSQ